MQFVDSINRILQMTGYIRGDTGLIVNFQNQQHAATMNVAIVCVQDALNDLVNYNSLPKQRVNGSLTLVGAQGGGTRTYALAANFTQFWQDVPYFYDSANNIEIYEYAGGEKQLQLAYYNYQTQAGYPNFFYWVDATAKTVGFFQVPDQTVNGKVITYDYESDLMVYLFNDVLPFQRDPEAFAFTEMAARRFEMRMAGLPLSSIQTDPAYVHSMGKVTGLVNPKKLKKRYGNLYLPQNPSLT